jgi:hypothetical protein
VFAGQRDGVLHGSGGVDVLIGGQGNDLVHGSAGRDVLVGGFGDDMLAARQDGPTLLAGTSGQDAHVEALWQFLSEASSGDSGAGRIDQLLTSNAAGDQAVSGQDPDGVRLDLG